MEAIEFEKSLWPMMVLLWQVHADTADYLLPGLLFLHGSSSYFGGNKNDAYALFFKGIVRKMRSALFVSSFTIARVKGAGANGGQRRTVQKNISIEAVQRAEVKELEK